MKTPGGWRAVRKNARRMPGVLHRDPGAPYCGFACADTDFAEAMTGSPFS
jgi:hypothetical protein